MKEKTKEMEEERQKDIENILLATELAIKSMDLVSNGIDMFTDEKRNRYHFKVNLIWAIVVLVLGMWFIIAFAPTDISVKNESYSKIEEVINEEVCTSGSN